MFFMKNGRKMVDDFFSEMEYIFKLKVTSGNSHNKNNELKNVCYSMQIGLINTKLHKAICKIFLQYLYVIF